MADSPWVGQAMRLVKKCELRADNLRFYSRNYPRTLSHQMARIKYDAVRARLCALLREKEESDD